MGEAVTLPQAVEQAIELLSALSIPLYQDHNGRPSLHGTGFFVKAGSDNYLVCAAHVMDTARDNGLYFYSSPRTRRHLSGQLLRTGPKKRRNEDLIDIGVLKLNGGAAPPYPDVNKFAMDLSYLKPRYRPRTDKSYVLIGFPGVCGLIGIGSVPLSGWALFQVRSQKLWKLAAMLCFRPLWLHWAGCTSLALPTGEPRMSSVINVVGRLTYYIWYSHNKACGGSKNIGALANSLIQCPAKSCSDTKSGKT